MAKVEWRSRRYRLAAEEVEVLLRSAALMVETPVVVQVTVLTAEQRPEESSYLVPVAGKNFVQ
jgi:hypothetical protein